MKLIALVPPPGFVAVAAAVLVLSALQVRDIAPRSESGAARGTQASVTETDILTIPLDAGIEAEAFASRPLFSQDRKDQSQIGAAVEPILTDTEGSAEAEILPRPPVRLIGLMIRGKVKNALFRSEEDGREEWRAVGDELFGWTLVEISQGSILLKSGETEITIRQFE